MRYHIKCHTFWLLFFWCLSLWPAPIWLGPILNSANTFSCLASHTCRLLNTFYTICVTLGMSLLHTLVAPEIPMNSGAGLTQIGLATHTRRSHTGYIRIIVADLSLGKVAVKTISSCLPPKLNSSPPATGQEAFYFRETLKDLVISNRMRLKSIRII